MLLFGFLVASTPRVLSEIFAVDRPSISHEELLVVHQEFVEAEKKKESEFSKTEKTKYQVPSEMFDPNSYNLEDWISLGLSRKQAEVVMKFSKRGLKSNDDLKRIFVFPIDLFELVKDSTFYPEKERLVEGSTVDEHIESVDLNSATPEDLVALPGIGAFYAKLIIERREKLGGYVGKEQLLELYKFDNERMKEIDQYIFVGSESLVQININTATLEELKSHPYIDYSIANSIVKMRAFDNYKVVEDLKRSKLIDEELFVKLKPYLTVQ